MRHGIADAVGSVRGGRLGVDEREQSGLVDCQRLDPAAMTQRRDECDRVVIGCKHFHEAAPLTRRARVGMQADDARASSCFSEVGDESAHDLDIGFGARFPTSKRRKRSRSESLLSASSEQNPDPRPGASERAPNFDAERVHASGVAQSPKAGER